MDPFAVVVAPPPTTIPPGPRPVTNERPELNVVNGTDASAKEARENPTVAVLRTEGENTCASVRLSTCIRNGVSDANSGSDRGMRLVPSSTVYALVNLSLWAML